MCCRQLRSSSCSWNMSSHSGCRLDQACRRKRGRKPVGRAAEKIAFIILCDDTVDLLIKRACVFFFIIIFLSINLMRALHSFQVPAWTLKTQFNCSVWRVKKKKGQRDDKWGNEGIACKSGIKVNEKKRASFRPMCDPVSYPFSKITTHIYKLFCIRVCQCRVICKAAQSALSFDLKELHLARTPQGTLLVDQTLIIFN